MSEPQPSERTRVKRYALPIWAGVLPMSNVPQTPRDDPRLRRGLEPPPNVTGYRRPMSRA